MGFGGNSSCHTVCLTSNSTNAVFLWTRCLIVPWRAQQHLHTMHKQQQTRYPIR